MGNTPQFWGVLHSFPCSGGIFEIPHLSFSPGIFPFSLYQIPSEFWHISQHVTDYYPTYGGKIPNSFLMGITPQLWGVLHSFSCSGGIFEIPHSSFPPRDFSLLIISNTVWILVYFPTCYWLLSNLWRENTILFLDGKYPSIVRGFAQFLLVCRCFWNPATVIFPQDFPLLIGSNTISIPVCFSLSWILISNLWKGNHWPKKFWVAKILGQFLSLVYTFLGPQHLLVNKF